MTIGRDAEWEMEHLLANASFSTAVAMASSAVAVFLGLSWLTEVAGMGWIQILVALGVVVVLVQAPPSDLIERGSEQSYWAFAVPLWIARTILLLALIVLWFTFVDLPSPSRWILAVVSSVVVGPLMWLASLQIRQAGFLAWMGRMSMQASTIVAMVAISQIVFWAAALGLWFGGYGTGIGLLATAVAAAWHLAGNLAIFKQISSEFSRTVQEVGGG